MKKIVELKSKKKIELKEMSIDDVDFCNDLAIMKYENDGDYHIVEDESRGNILTYDLWWIGYNTKDERGRKWLNEFCNINYVGCKKIVKKMSKNSYKKSVKFSFFCKNNILLRHFEKITKKIFLHFFQETTK